MSYLKASAIDEMLEQAQRAGIPANKALPGKNLNGDNHYGREFRNFDFKGTALKGADLSGALLNGANFENAQLRGANLSGAKLCGANLSNADLNGANLSRGDLSGAVLYGANLRNANLNRIDLSSTDVRDANFGENSGIDEVKQRKLEREGANFRDFNSSINLPQKRKYMKWWVRHVIVQLLIALIGSGGIVTIINAVKSENTLSKPIAPNKNK